MRDGFYNIMMRVCAEVYHKPISSLTADEIEAVPAFYAYLELKDKQRGNGCPLF